MTTLDLLTGDAHAFREEAWGRRVHVHTIPPEELAGIFDLEQADHLITQTALRTPQIRLAKDGAVISEHRYQRQATIAGRPMTGLTDPRKVLDFFSDGATIIFQGLQRYWEPLRQLVRGLEAELGHPCQANAYLTPPGSQGFALHSDSHDVIVFQTHGAKEWEVHEDGQPRQIMMSAGTAMYMPTGTPHMARTQDTASLHVTVGINRYLWRDLLKRVVDPALASERFDEALPAGLFNDSGALAQQLHTKLDELIAEIRARGSDDAVRRLETSFATSRQPVLGGGLVDRLTLRDLTADTPVRRRPGATVTLREAGDRLELLLGDRVVTMPGGLRDIIERIVGTDGDLRASDLHDEVEESSALLLVGRLVREGLLTTAVG